jgi:hypothetical protein
MSRVRAILAILLVCLLVGRAAGMSFTFTYEDPGNIFGSRGWLDPNSLFQRNIRAAANLWAAHFTSNATIVIKVDNHSYAARAGGTSSNGRLLYTNAAGKKVWEPGPLTRVLTGSNPGQTAWGFDILLGFDANFVQNNYWFDPQPDLRTTAVPSNKGDFISVVMHELGHGFGMTGYRNFDTGLISGPDTTLFEDKSYFGGNGAAIGGGGVRNPMFFRGDLGKGVYGSDLHLVNVRSTDVNFSQNYFHLSSCGSADDGLRGTLMNGCVLPNGARLDITAFDAAVYGDLGYPLITPSGDYNGNHTVDAADYVAWRNTVGQTGTGLAADGNLNYQIDSGDFSYWRSRFGRAAGSGVEAENPVPEPGVTVLLVAAFLVTCASRRFPRPLFRQH